jgi:hypothetical protein
MFQRYVDRLFSEIGIDRLCSAMTLIRVVLKLELSFFDLLQKNQPNKIKPIVLSFSLLSFLIQILLIQILQEATEDLVKAHFSRWGVVTDVYFPRHKKTLKRRPFCFVTFAMKDSAERALAESPLSICGIPIKNLTMVEDRDKYYKEKHAAAHQALLIALNSMGAAGALAPEQVNNIAALLAMEGVSSDAVLSMLLNPSQQNFIAQQQMAPPQSNSMNSNSQGGMQNPFASPAGFGHGGHGHGYQQNPTRYSAPLLGQSGPAASDFFFQQQQQQLHNYNQNHHQQHHHHHHQYSHHHLPPMAASSGSGTSTNSIRSASGPLPSSIGPFGSMMSREGSFSSLSTISDWYSTTSSNRTSLDLGNGSFWGPAAGQPPARLSLDAALQLRQQLMAVASANQGQGGGHQQHFADGGDGGLQQAQLLVAQNLARLHQQQQQQQQHSPPPPAAVMQSAFYQSAATPMPINNNNNQSGNGSGGVSSPLQGGGSLPLPPIREGQPAPLDPYTAAVWASGGSTLLRAGSGGGGNGSNNQGMAQFLGGSPVLRPTSSSPFSSGPISPVRSSPNPSSTNNDNNSANNNNNNNNNVAVQLRELSLSDNSLRGSPNAGGGNGLPLGVPDSSNSDQDSLQLASSRNASGGFGTLDGLLGGGTPAGTWTGLESPPDPQRPSA